MKPLLPGLGLSILYCLTSTGQINGLFIIAAVAMIIGLVYILTTDPAFTRSDHDLEADKPHQFEDVRPR